MIATEFGITRLTPHQSNRVPAGPNRERHSAGTIARLLRPSNKTLLRTPARSAVLAPFDAARHRARAAVTAAAAAEKLAPEIQLANVAIPMFITAAGAVRNSRAGPLRSSHPP